MIGLPVTPLQRAVMDQKIAILMLDEGETCAELLTGVAATMELVLLASKKPPKALESDFRACLHQIERNALQKATVKLIIRGLDTCLWHAPRIPKAAIDQAWLRMQR